MPFCTTPTAHGRLVKQMTSITPTLSDSSTPSVTRRRRSPKTSAGIRPAYPGARPLVVDLDGTLVQGDLLIELAFAYLGRNPLRIFSLLANLFQGKAALKAHIASATALDVERLPYDAEVLTLIDKARSDGRPVYLVSASNERYVSAIANHLGVFDGWLASDETHNLSATAKANRLIADFGDRGFDYVGNCKADLPVWQHAHRCLATRTSVSVRAKLLAFAPEAVFLPTRDRGICSWTKLLRVHQWAKNALVAVPLVTAHRFNIELLAEVLGAAVCFSLAASSIYILNDLVDIGADRAHPTKNSRPLAAGTVSVLDALLAMPILLAASLIGAWIIGQQFTAVILAYLALTTAYTFVLKRKMMVDVIALAALYTIRVIGGAVAISVHVSEWLLAFSMFMFVALALVKRYVELIALLDADLPNPSNRNYLKSDLNIVAMLATAAAFNAITVFALYISSPAVIGLYRHPEVLWLACPVLMYWLGRLMMLAHRRLVNDDPVVFALRDWNSLVVASLIGAILWAAT